MEEILITSGLLNTIALIVLAVVVFCDRNRNESLRGTIDILNSQVNKLRDHLEKEGLPSNIRRDLGI